MYRLTDTAGKIVTPELIRKGFFLYFPEMFFDLLTLQELEIPLDKLCRIKKMPWGEPYMSGDLVYAANTTERIFDDPDFSYIRLWDDTSDAQNAKQILRLDQTRDSVILLAKKASRSDDSSRRPAAIVCAGGGYSGVAFLHEGLDTALELEKNGYGVFVLYYRTTPNRYPEPQKDLALAVKYVRTHADDYGIDPDDIMITGYSAGGHLVASESLYADEIEKLLMEDLKQQYPLLYKTYKGICVKADKVSLNYPVISMCHHTHEESARNLTGDDKVLREKLSIELHAGPDFPKTFIWANDDDPEVNPDNARRLAERLRSQGAEVLYQTFPSGGHGCALGEGTSCEGWIDTMIGWMKGKADNKC